MLIHGTPLTHLQKADADMTDRFWYWRGASGRTYIHSVYDLDLCPPLPGAVFVAVRRCGPLRVALAAGLLPSLWSLAPLPALRDSGVTELHVHLLAENCAEAGAVARDLMAALSHEDMAKAA
jgi:hypothetical protein